MSIASNPLLQLPGASNTPITAVSSATKAADASGDKASSFADLYARHNQAQSAKAASNSARAANKAAVASHAAPEPKAKPASADKPALADSGKPLPAKRDVADAKGGAKTDARADRQQGVQADRADARDAAQVKSDSNDRASAANVANSAEAAALASETGQQAVVDDTAQTDLLASDPGVDENDQDDADDTVVNDPGATLLADLKAAPQPDASQPAASLPDLAATAQTQLDPSLIASLMPGSISAPPTAPGERPATSDLDPAPDALADLPAVRMALEQSARAQGTTSAHAQAAVDPGQTASPADSSFVNGLAAQLAQQQTSDAGAASALADKDFQASLGDSAKQTKDASADARIDNFANRLQGLAEVITPRAVAATPQATPLAMNQGGWSESLVNRVMYLSSQNLKSADIQLSPAELGKLDIRVDMGPDQQTQVTFVSAHIGVRDALESQQGRLKELFAQQGLGQMDVNVSDQSRNQQGQEQQAQQASRGGASGGRVGRDSGEVADVAPSAVESVAPSVVIGSSAVDYYA